MRSTRTFVLLDVSQAAYDEISAALHEAGYDHAFVEVAEYGTCLDMDGIAISRKEPT